MSNMDELEALRREWVELNRDLNKSNAELERLKLERETEFEKIERDLREQAEKIKVSHHKYGEDFRKGYVMWGSADRHLLELIEKHLGTDNAEYISEFLDNYADESMRFAARFRYFELASTAVLMEKNSGELVSVDDAIWGKRQDPEGTATHLAACCKSFQDLLETPDTDWNLFELASLVSDATMWYHEMSLLLVERPALNHMKQGAKGRSKIDKHVKQRAIALGADYVERQQNLGRKINKSATGRHVLRKLGLASKELPSLNAVIGWLKEEGILS